jgi:hypothetical protein
VATVLGAWGSAGAFEIPTGNDDLEIHWDNTFRYTLGQRVKGQNRDIINSPNNDDGDRNFDVGIVTNRLDILSELDAVYRKSYGVRLSGAGWYDQRYHNHLDNTSPTSNHLANGQPAVGLSSYTERYFAGPSGELLDAFAFGKFDLGDVPVSARVGRHTVYWGESLLPFAGTHGISYGQSPIDLGKALAQPGVELKEIFRPLNQVSVQIQPTKTLTLLGQYYLQWESDRFPEGGSYLGFADMYLNGGESVLTPPPPAGLGIIHNGGDITPKQARDWGLGLRWSPEWLDGTLGLYYRNFSDKLPQLLVQPAAGTFRFAYASDIDLYGISFAKNIAGISVGSEFSYRHNMPLVSQALVPVGVPGTPGVPGTGDTAGARGDTWHALVNFLGLLSKNPLFDEATCLVEFTWSGWTHVGQGNEFFLGRTGYSGIDRVTKDAMTGAINFAPVWRQVVPGVDLTMPLSIASGLYGTAAVTTGGAAKNGSYSAGLSFDIFAKYKADLTYVGFFGNYKTDPAFGGTIPPPGGGSAGTGAGDVFGLLKDRDMVSLTLKATF